VIRIAIGPGRQRIELQKTALERLAAGSPPPLVAERVPRLLGAGEVGLAGWSAEERLPGSTAPHELAPKLLSDCIDFLVALHVVDRGETGAAFVDSAKIVASFCSNDEHREAVLELGNTLDAELAGLPRGFGHGDFWSRNLLVAGNRLQAVIDWDGAKPGQPPLLDLVHLRLSAHREKTREYLGTALVRHQLPWAAAGGDELTDLYCRRIGFEVDANVLKWLAFAYWLERIAFELNHNADRVQRPVWMRNNIELVLDAFRDHVPTRPGTRQFT
jgi:aminoglycoside phosphotransferase (APT) family kinase protein